VSCAACVSGEDRPVILFRLLRLQLEYSRPLIKQVDTARNEIIAVDLPGHGLFSAPRVDYTQRFFTGAAAEFLDHCPVKRPPSPCI
jgi:hypothetical protein